MMTILVDMLFFIVCVSSFGAMCGHGHTTVGGRDVSLLAQHPPDDGGCMRVVKNVRNGGFCTTPRVS